MVNLGKSDIDPSQVVTYLGIKFNSRVGLAYVSEKRIKRWISIAEEFLTRQSQTALSWLCLLGPLVSIDKLVSDGPLDSKTRDSILWWLDMTNLRGDPFGGPCRVRCQT